MVTDPGKVAAEFPLVSDITQPVPPAGPLSVTVPVEDSPPGTVDGLSVSDTSAGGLIVKGIVIAIGPKIALIEAVAAKLTAVVVIVNVPVV